MFSGILDLRSCVDPLHASLCVVVQCLLRPGVAGLRVHMYNCAPAVAVTRLLWSLLCLHLLCSVGAAAGHSSFYTALLAVPIRSGHLSYSVDRVGVVIAARMRLEAVACGVTELQLLELVTLLLLPVVGGMCAVCASWLALHRACLILSLSRSFFVLGQVVSSNSWYSALSASASVARVTLLS